MTYLGFKVEKIILENRGKGKFCDACGWPLTDGIVNHNTTHLLQSSWLTKKGLEVKSLNLF